MDLNAAYTSPGSAPGGGAPQNAGANAISLALPQFASTVDAVIDHAERADTLNLLGAVATIVDSSRLRLLLEAARKENPQLTKMTFEGGGTLLHVAVHSRARGNIAPLIEFGFDIDARDDQGRTALQVCALALIESGAKPDGTDMMLAVLAGFRAVRLLLTKTDVSPDIMGPDGLLPLQRAIHRRDDEVVATLLTHGANFNAVVAEGHTALEWAVNLGSDIIVRSLMMAGCAGNVSRTVATQYLHKAVERGDKTWISHLRRYRLDFNAIHATDGRTPLHRAATAGNLDLELVSMLLDAGASWHGVPAEILHYYNERVDYSPQAGS